MKNPDSMVRSSTIGYALLFLAALLLGAWQGRLEELFPEPEWPETGWNILVGLVLAAAVLSAGAALRGTFLWARRLEDEFRVLLGEVTPAGAFVMSVASGIAEETFFRGIMQPAFGLVVTSLFFGLLHLPVNRRMVPWTVIAIAMGFLLGVVYQQTQSLLGVALAHSTVNFVEFMGLGRPLRPVDGPDST
jgi:membrane protease YdiL (CAAX protease family)